MGTHCALPYYKGRDRRLPDDYLRTSLLWMLIQHGQGRGKAKKDQSIHNTQVRYLDLEWKLKLAKLAA